MPELTLIKTRLAAGIWEGVLSGPVGATPMIEARHRDQPLSGVTCALIEPGQWRLRVPVPPTVISDGVQTVVIQDAEGEEVLASFALIAGEPLADDMRAELSLLRDELDMLKRAFRRHCVESALPGELPGASVTQGGTA